MKVEMVMPQMGESIAEGTVLKWLKKAGEKVEKDENILEISTDKVDSEIPSPASGTIIRLLAEEGDTVPVGNIVAEIETEAGEVADSVETTPTEAPAASALAEPFAKDPVREPAPTAGSIPATASPAPIPSGPDAEIPPRDAAGRYYSPLVRSIARKEAVSLEELAGIAGSGRGGRVTRRDLTSYLDRRRSSGAVAPPVAPARPVSRPIEAAETRMSEDGAIDVVPMDHIRQKIADHMVRSKATSPHVYSVTEADMTRIVRYRTANKESFLRREGFKLTYTPYFVLATVRALIEFPYVNASIDGTNILVKRFVNIGLAVDVDYGLIVPVICRADNLNFLGIARAVHDLANRARTKSLKPDEVTGGTFSITNMGTVGNLFGVPIIAQPQVAILGIGAIQKRVAVRDEAIAIRDMVYLCLSYDHRLVDGAMGGSFIERVVHHLHTMELE